MFFFYLKIEFSIFDKMQSSSNKQMLSNEFYKCNIHLQSKLHQENMSIKNHSLHCIIHKYIGYFLFVYTLKDVNRLSGYYHCDFEWQQLNYEEYKIQLEKKCVYYNENFVRYEQQAINNIKHLD